MLKSKKTILGTMLCALMALCLTLGVMLAMPIKTYAIGTEEHNHVGWTGVTELPTEAGNYVLTCDVTLSSTWNVPEGTTNLCLNGYVIKANCTEDNKFSVITVGAGATLNLYDCDTTTKYYFSKDATTGLWTLAEDQTTPTDYYVTGGIITGGNATTNGGGINVSGIFNMYGGNIAGNTAQNGGGVSNSKSFTMTDGNIVGNTATTNGGGVYASTSSIFANILTLLTGGTITDNTAQNGGGLYYKVEECFAPGTLITMADGTRQAIETLKIGDSVRVFDHEKGEISSSKIFDVWTYPEKHSGVVKLYFSNDIDVTVVYGHSFFEHEQNKYVAVTRDNVSAFVGHEFYNVDNKRWETLEGYEFIDGEVDTYVITTEYQLNCVANGMLSNEDGFYALLTNIFEYGDNLKIDQVKKEQDIANFGLYGYENIKHMSKHVYDILNFQYLKVAFGKDLITENEFNYLEAYYAEVDPELYCNGKEETPVESKSILLKAPLKAPLLTSSVSAPESGFYVGGSIKMLGNNGGNLYLSSGKTITIGTGTVGDGNGVVAPTKDMNIGITLADGTGKFTINGTADYSANFFSDSDSYKVCFNKGTDEDTTDDCLELKTAYAITNNTKKDDKTTNHGYIVVDKNAVENEKVVVTVVANERYKLKADSLKATYNDGTELELTASDNNTYTFKMPAYAVTVTAEFEAIPHIHGEGTENEITFATPWDGGIDHNSMPTKEGSYYLLNNVILSESWAVPEGVTNLCLNGFVINANCTEDNKFSVITVGEGATLNLYDCGTTEHNGYVDANGLWHLDEVNSHVIATGETTKKITGGIITGGNASGTGFSIKRQGGGVHVAGTLNMFGGNIAGNIAQESGGGVYVADGSFTMNGGAISYNYALDTGSVGGGISGANSSFTLNSGTISHNSANSGGGIYFSGTSSMEMNGGIITDNTARKAQGGGIYAGISGTFTMTAGSITNNQAVLGGGIFVSQNQLNFSMSGGTITGNNVSGVNNKGTIYSGGGVCVYFCNTVTLGGTAQIIGNTLNNDVPSNLWLIKDKTITLGTDNDAPTTMSIGITTQTAPTELAPIKITADGTADDVAYFFSDSNSFRVCFNAGTEEAGDENLELKLLVAERLCPYCGGVGRSEYNCPICYGFKDSCCNWTGKALCEHCEGMGYIKYLSLKDAIDDISGNETIILLADNEEEIEISKVITFDIDAGDFTNDATFSTVDNYVIEISENEGVATYAIKKPVEFDSEYEWNDGEDITYGDTYSKISPKVYYNEVEVTELSFTFVYYQTTDGETWTKLEGVATDAGDYKVVIAVNDATYCGSKEFTFTIGKAEQVITINDISKIYDASPVYFAVNNYYGSTCTTLGDGEVTVEYKLATEDDDKYTTTAPINAGSYVVRVSVAETETHLSGFITKEFTISQREVTLTWGETTFAYNNQQLLPTVTAGNLANSDKVTVTVVPNKESVNVGEYVATATALSNDNYKLAETNLTTNFVINKADYDMTGITFTDKTVKTTDSPEDKKLAISGTLPTGLDGVQLSVSYVNNDNTERGVYTVTAKFSTTSINYNTPSDMTAVLTILWVRDSEKESGSDNEFVIVTSETGIDPTLTLKVDVVKIDNSDSQYKEVADSIKKEDSFNANLDKIFGVYDVSLIDQNDVKVQPDGTIKVYMTIPEEIKNCEFRIYHIHNGVASKADYVIDDGYAVIETDELSEFVFVYEQTSLLPWIIVLSVISALGLAGIVLLIVKNKKDKQGRK